MREIQIDLAAIRDNYLTLKKTFAPAKVMAVIKANAYGHGMHEIAAALEQVSVDQLGVADLAEALELRSAGVAAPIMCWLLGPADDLQLAKESGIALGISTLSNLARVPSDALIHIKIDTGLGRNGFMLDQLPAVIEMVKDRKLTIAGVFSHIANTSEAEDWEQNSKFQEALALLDAAGIEVETRHLAASAAALSYPEMHYDMVRCGLIVYGLNPFDDRQLDQVSLSPAMRVSAEIINIKQVAKGQGVSYGYRFVTQEPTRLGLVPFGYAEGMPRVSVGAKVLINGKLLPVVGSIAMDQFVVDLGSTAAEIGDEVVIFGNAAAGEPTAEQLGESSGSINYEIVTRIGGRANRVYLGQ